MKGWVGVVGQCVQGWLCFTENHSDSAVGVLGELILQVTDSLFLRENCSLQTLNLLYKLFQQLRLARRGQEEQQSREKKGMEWQSMEERRRRIRTRENRTRKKKVLEDQKQELGSSVQVRKQSSERKVPFQFKWRNRVKRWWLEWNMSERWTVDSLASCFHRQTTCSCEVQAWCPEHSSWPPLALCSSEECSHPSVRLGWGLHLAPPTILQALVQGLDLLYPDRGHPETDLTGGEERRIIRTGLGLN